MDPAETYALVIGINNYASPEISNLTAACNDADSMATFLQTIVRLPSQNLINLRNEQATRHGILGGFKELEKLTAKYFDKTGGNEQDPGPGPCMIIFFAGHGARAPKPIANGWGDWAPDSTHVEMLCPSDIGMPLSIDRDGNVNDTGKLGVVEGIPDRTVCWLLNQLSKSRGNNITLILDCCHSAGINRTNRLGPEFVAREIMWPPPLSGKADPEVDWALTDQEWEDEENPKVGRAIHQTPGFGGKFHESHVLLSACGKEQKAYEEGGSGLFTAALLALLPQEVKKPSLTYATLMLRLKVSSVQTPHCEGSNINKLLFTRQGSSSDPLFIRCWKIKQKTPDGPPRYALILGAGAAQGIAPGELFSIHENNLLVTEENPNHSIGILRSSEVRTASSTLKRPRKEDQFTMATHFYAKRIDWSNEPPKVYCVDRAWLNTIFPPTDMTKKIVVVENEQETSLTLEVEGERIYCSRKDPSLEACQVPKRFPYALSASKQDDIRAVVGGWQHFSSHLNRRGSEFSDVRMELHFLKEIVTGKVLSDEEAQQPENFKVDGGDLLSSEPATLLLPDPDVEEKPLGVTLHNDGGVSLYPYLFYFDPNYLTIIPWYLTPIGAGRGKVDPPLGAHSKFCIGYGHGAAAPWSFRFEDGRTKDIGYFKLFVSTSPINFDSLIREESPFEQGEFWRTGTSDASDGVGLDNFSWGVKVATVIQQRQ